MIRLPPYPPHPRLRRAVSGFLTAILVVSGCQDRGPPQPPIPSQTSVVYWRISPPQPDHPPSPQQVASILNSANGDIVILDVDGIASSSEWLAQVHSLLPHLPNAEFPAAGRDTADVGLAVLGRFALHQPLSAPDLAYRIGTANLHPRFGIAAVESSIPDAPSLRCIMVSAKDKTYHPAGQTEMRRNELRMIGDHIRTLLAVDPSACLLILGALNDDPNAATVRDFLAAPRPGLTDLRPTDSHRDAWTTRDPSADRYLRHLYALGSPALNREWNILSSEIINFPPNRRVSLHRPIRIILQPASSARHKVYALPGRAPG